MHDKIIHIFDINTYINAAYVIVGAIFGWLTAYAPGFAVLFAGITCVSSLIRRGSNHS